MSATMVTTGRKPRQRERTYNPIFMAWMRWFLLGVALGLGGLYFIYRAPADAGRLVAEFARNTSGASVRRPRPEAFTETEAVVAGQRKPAIAVNEPSRIAWDFDLPSRASLEVSLGLREDTWSAPGDGVLFRVGISFDGRYEELVTRVVNPRAIEADRSWIPVTVDLSAFAGKKVSLIFNTGPGLDGDNRENDHALWGEPRVVIR